LNTRLSFGLSELIPGSRLRLTGIGVVNFPSDKTRAHGTLALQLRDPGDVVVIATPPWLTLRRAGLILAVLVAVCSLAGLWIYQLHGRVERQTGVIHGHMTREVIHEERARIARDFHDTVQQQLAGINLELQTAELNLDQSPAEALKSVELSRQMIRHTLAETRQTIWDLRSPALEQGGLITALEDFAASLRKSNPAKIELHVTGNQRRFPGALEQGLFRIAQEAVTNALKHGHARHCTVTVDFTERAVQLRVQDDGCGFEPGQSLGAGELHFGLLGMHERANKLRAALDVHSEPGKGTVVSVTAEIPL
jgi:signal transduction histidine kinase